MFSNGEFDPWRSLSVQADLSINPNALLRPFTTSVPKCNESPQNNSVFGQCYSGQVCFTMVNVRYPPYLLEQVHVSDLLAAMNIPMVGETSPFDKGFDLFSVALDQWFQCFHDFA